MLGDPIVIGSVVLIGIGTHMLEDGIGHVTALDTMSGMLLWSLDTSGLVRTGMARDNDTVIAITSTSEPYALR